MLHPSYSELIDVLNSDTDNDNYVTSRYTIVIATAKRARQIVEKSKRTSAYDNDKAVSIAVSEMSEGKIKIKLNAQAKRENREYDEAGLGGFDKKPEEKISMSLNLDTFDDDFDDYDDFDDALDLDLEDIDPELILNLDIDEDLDDIGEDLDVVDELDDDSFDDSFEAAEDDDSFDDEDGYGD